MKALKYGFGLILVGGFALTASCGGSSDDSSGPSGGTSASKGGTGGTGTGTTGGTGTGTTGGTGTGTTGGTGTGTTGGTGTGTTGGTGTGGTGAGGTGAPSGGSGGGTTANPAFCPATAPAIPAMGTPGPTCTPPTNPRDVCTYVAGTMTETCNCRVARGGGPGGGQAGAAPATDGTLNCRTAPTPIACAATPETGQACTGGCPVPGSRRGCACTMGALVCPVAMGAAGAPG